MVYHFEIVHLEVFPDHIEGKPDSLAVVHWRMVGEQGGIRADLAGATGLNQSASIEAFVPFNDLTEAQVIAWVRETMGQESVERYERNIANEIAHRIKPRTVGRTAPWEPVP
jgi:hypothetical protein